MVRVAGVERVVVAAVRVERETLPQLPRHKEVMAALLPVMLVLVRAAEAEAQVRLVVMQLAH